MRTKLFTLIAAIAFTFGATNAFADGEDQGATLGKNQGQVNLTIELNPIQTLVVNQKNVVLKYKTQKDYNDGVTSEKKEHLTVTSTGAYVINVKASDFKYDANDASLEKIKLSHIGLVTSGSTTKASTSLSYTPLTGLTNEDQQIVSSDFGGVGEKYNVTYSAKGENYYLENNYIKDKQVKLSTTVTYTIVAN